jgi:hypothetical protein
MIRTITSFVDPSIAFNITCENQETYQNASLLRERLVRLVQDMSVYTACSEQHFSDALSGDTVEKDAEDMANCFKGMYGVHFGNEYAEQFREASTKVYRLETILRYEPEKDAPRGANHELVLRLSFYEKGVRKAFFKFDVFFSITNHGRVYYLDSWPEVLVAEKTE